MIFKEIRRCKTKGALEVIPEQPVDLPLDMVEQLLGPARFDVVNAGVLLVCSRDDITETTIWEDGHMLVKTLDPAEAHNSAARLFEAATGRAEDSTFDEYILTGRLDLPPPHGQ